LAAPQDFRVESWLDEKRSDRAPTIGKSGENALLYMIIEYFRNNDPVPVYRRFRDRGRLAPEGLQYLSSWVDEELKRCFQLMETEDRKLLDEWIANWNDIVEFEVYPVISSKEAAEKMAPYL
jgi:hypothetical protein